MDKTNEGTFPLSNQAEYASHDNQYYSPNVRLGHWTLKVKAEEIVSEDA